MPRPKKPVDIAATLASLELLTNNMALSESVRSEAAREYVRLKLLSQPPAPAPATPTVRVEPTTDELREAFRTMAAESEALLAKTQKTPAKPADPSSESATFAHEQVQAKKNPAPEPVERERGSIWEIGGQSYRYMGFLPDTKEHLVTPVKGTSIFPEVERVTEQVLRGVKQRPVVPVKRGYELPEEVLARRAKEMARDRAEYVKRGGSPHFGNPTLEW